MKNPGISESEAFDNFVNDAKNGTVFWREVFERIAWRIACETCGAPGGRGCKEHGMILHRSDMHARRLADARCLLSGFEP